jgi:hypothetical protein
MKKAMIEIMKKLSQTAGGKKMTPKQLEDRFSQVNPASANRSLETLKKAGLVSQDIKPFGKKKGGEVKQMMSKKKYEEGGEVDKKLLREGAKMLKSSPKPKYFLEAAGEAAKNIKAIPPDMQKQKAKDKNKKLDRLIEQKTKIDRVKYGKKKGGKVSSCSKRADGCAVRGKTKGKMI